MASPHQLSKHLIKMQERLNRKWAIAVMHLLERRLMEAGDDFGALGDLSLADLAAMGHPYSHKHPSDTPYDDRLIHEQSGELHRAMYTQAQRTGRDVTVALLIDIIKAPYWLALKQGTSKMRQRDLGSKVDEHFVTAIWPELVTALKRTFREAAKESR